VDLDPVVDLESVLSSTLLDQRVVWIPGWIR